MESIYGTAPATLRATKTMPNMSPVGAIPVSLIGIHCCSENKRFPEDKYTEVAHIR